MTTPTQPKLFTVEDGTTTGALDLFPTVWQAAENLAAPNSSARKTALDELIDLDAARLSPLIAYLIATRLNDPDRGLRAKIIKVLAGVLGPDNLGRPAPDGVRGHLVSYISQLGESEILDLLEAGKSSPDLAKPLAKLLNLCPKAGIHLGEILSKRANGIEIRTLAAYLIGQVGFVDAITALKRTRNRIETRQQGQTSMPFAPQGNMADEGNLLPAINEALSLLDAV